MLLYMRMALSRVMMRIQMHAPLLACESVVLVLLYIVRSSTRAARHTNKHKINYSRAISGMRERDARKHASCDATRYD